MSTLCAKGRAGGLPLKRAGHAQEEKEEGEEGMDAEAAERRRTREAEEWRLKQLRSGVSSQANSNFQVSARRLLLPASLPARPQMSVSCLAGMLSTQLASRCLQACGCIDHVAGLSGV